MGKSLKQKFAYKFDNFMAKGARSIFMALLILFLIGFIILAAGRVITGLYVSDDAETGLEIWRIFLQLTDPGNMAQDNGTAWYLKIFAIVAGMFGVVFFSAVIAIITTQLDIKLEDLKKGRSHVVEKGHILILGWSTEIMDIIRELIIANESESDGCVVILSAKDKEEMDDFLKEQIPDRQTTRIITRTGDPGVIASLHRVAVTEAKSVILLPTCGPGAPKADQAHSDALTLKTLLALLASCKEKGEIPQTVAQVYNPANKRVIMNLAPEKITLADPEDMIAKIAVQTSRSSGLAAVYSSLIGFDGCEFYFTRSSWNGIQFGEIHFHYPDGIALGVRQASGDIVLNPEISYTLKSDDDLILLAEDDSTINFQKNPVIKPAELQFSGGTVEREKEKVLIIGWNNKASTVISEYLDYIKEDSVIDVILPESHAQAEDAVVRLNGMSDSHTVASLDCDLMDMDAIEKLSPEAYNSIVILTETEDDQEKADAATINILLLLREVIRNKQSKDSSVKTPQIITEVLNSDNLELISQTGANDAIISIKMVSKILAQVAEEPDVLEVYGELFKEEGCEIYLKNLDLYVKDNTASVQFADLIRIAQKREEICMGYRIKELKNDVSSGFGVVINPPKDSSVDLKKLDCLIVLAEDEL